MTNAEYVLELTGDKATLVSNLGVLLNEDDLDTDEYFAIMIYSLYHSYMRNYKEYHGQSNYNDTNDVHDIDLMRDYGKQVMISKDYRKLFNLKKGRIIIINVPTTTNFTIVDD